MTRWFRHYSGLCRDDKLVSAAIKAKQPIERVVWIWCAILESAAELNAKGQYEFDAAEAAYFLHVDIKDIRSVLAALHAVGRLKDGTVVKWTKRQFEADFSKERVAAHRERKRAHAAMIDEDVTLRNSDVTLQGRYGNGPETESESEAEAKIKIQKQKQKKATSQKPHPDIQRGSEAFQSISVQLKAVTITEFNKVGAEPPNMSRLSLWLEQGFTAEEILGCIRAILARGTKPKTLKYFDQALESLRHVQPEISVPLRATPKRGSSAVVQALDEVGK